MGSSPSPDALAGEALVLTGGPQRPDATGNDSEPDSALIRAAREGDRSAYARLYHRFAPMVHGLLLTRVARDLADDLVQDVFLKALSELGTLRDDMRFGAWIAAIARRRAVDFYRRERERQDDGERIEGTAVPEASSARAEANAVLSVLQSLPEAYRETLVLRLVEGMTGPEISSRTGLSHGSVRVNLHRGMKLLRERLRNRPERGPTRRREREGDEESTDG